MEGGNRKWLMVHSGERMDIQSFKIQLFPIKSLVIKYSCNLPIHSGQLSIVAVVCSCVSAIDGVVIAFQGHGSLAGFVVGAAKEVVGQQAVVGSAVAVEEADVGLYVLRGEGLVGAVTLIETVQPLSHGSALPLCSTADHRHQEGKNK